MGFTRLHRVVVMNKNQIKKQVEKSENNLVKYILVGVLAFAMLPSCSSVLGDMAVDFVAIFKLYKSQTPTTAKQPTTIKEFCE